MPETPQPRRAAAALALGLTAAVIVGVSLAVPDDPDRRPLVVNLIDAVAWFMGGVVLLSMREGKVARSSRAVGLTFLIGAAVIGLVFVSGLAGPPIAPGFADLLFLLPLITLLWGFRSEIRHHVPAGDRRELATDAALIVSALMAAGYVLIRPAGATSGVSASAVTFALLTAFLVASYPALAIWVPTRAHIARAIVFAGLGAAVLMFGWQWTHQTYDATNAAIELPIALSPLAVVATFAVRAPDPHERRRDRDLRGPANHRRARRRQGAHRLADRPVHRRPRARGRGAHHREPDHRDAGGRVGAACARPERGGARRHGCCARTRPRGERDPEEIRRAPPAGLRRRGRRDRGAGRQRRRRAGERGLLSDGAPRPLHGRRTAMASDGGLARRRRREVQRAPVGGRPGRARTFGRHALVPGVTRVRDPHRPTSQTGADPRCDAGQGRRPDHPLAAEVPAGEGRGSHQLAPADELGDRVGAQPDRAGSARRAGAGCLGRVALARSGAPHDRRGGRGPGGRRALEGAERAGR